MAPHLLPGHPFVPDCTAQGTPVPHVRGKTKSGLHKRQMALPMVIDVGSTDVMAALRRLKEEVEQKRGTRMYLVLSARRRRTYLPLR
jgi:hypothetical protein